MMVRFHWNDDKNRQLKHERNVSFEDVIAAVAGDRLLDIIEPTNRDKFAHQRILAVEMNQYAYLVPFVIDDDIWFLKTIIPSRKATRDYLHRRSQT